MDAPPQQVPPFSPTAKRHRVFSQCSGYAWRSREIVIGRWTHGFRTSWQDHRGYIRGGILQGWDYLPCKERIVRTTPPTVTPVP
jgi:hypothetical protein